MSSLRFSALALLLIVLASGCAAQTAEPRTETSAGVSVTGNEDLVSAGPGSSRESFAALSDAQNDQVERDFVARNGSDWRLIPNAREAVDRFTGAITQAYRSGSLGPDVPLTRTEATLVATTWLRKNADSLGLESNEVNRLIVTVDGSNDGGDTAKLGWQLEVSGLFAMPGYEEFAELAKTIQLYVVVDRDGGVRAVLQHSTILPNLSLRKTPGLAYDDARVTAAVLNRALVYYANLGLVLHEPTYLPCVLHEAHDLGLLEETDIKAQYLAFKVDKGTALTVTLTYRIEVTKDGHDFEFVVDAGTGEVLAEPAVYEPNAMGEVWLYLQDGVPVPQVDSCH